MPVAFERIPQNLRVPLFYVEVTPRMASYFTQQQVALLIGPMLPSGIATPLTPVMVNQFEDAAGLFGAGSVLADMVGAFRRNDGMGELWAIPHLPAAGATAASTEATITGPATGNGALYVYIAGDRYVFNVSAGMTAAEIAAGMVAAAAAEPFMLVDVTAHAVDPERVVLTSKTAGTIGNEIDLGLNMRGVAAGEMLPPGVGINVPNMAGGVGVPPWADLVAAMADDEYDFIASPYHDPASLDALDDLLDDVTGRWAWDRQIYGGAFTARKGSAQELRDYGVLRNGPHVTVFGFPHGATSPPWRHAAATTAQIAVATRADPGRPLQTLPLVGVLPPQRGRGFTIGQSDTLLKSGISTEMAERDGRVRIQRAISTYQRNAWGQPDPSWLDVETSYQLIFIIRFLRQRITQKFPRHKLANDGTPFGAGQAVATPSIIRTELVAAYSELQQLGIVENMQAFKEHLIVERDQNDPNRVNVLFPPDLINQLRVFAALVEFRLRYTPAAAA